MADQQKFSPEEIKVNTDVLNIHADDKRHYQNATFTVMVLFLSANTAIFLPLEYLEKVFGAALVGAMGLASVVVSFLSAMDSRRSWFRAMRKGFATQEGLKAAGVRFFSDPFGSKPTRGALKTTHLVHGVVALAWLCYLQNKGVPLEWWHAIAGLFAR